MNLQLRPPQLRQDGDLCVYVNGSGMKTGGEPYAVIQLDDDGSADLTFGTPEDIDRLIKAASEAKRLLAAARTPHPFTADEYAYRCETCGVLKGHHPEPETAA